MIKKPKGNSKSKKVKNQKIAKNSDITVKPYENLKLKYLMALVIAVTGFLLYSNTIDHGFVLDDNSAIENNWVVKKGYESIPTIFKTSYRYGFWKGVDELYRPIPLSVFAIIWESFPNNPKPFHLLNVILYAVLGLTLFLTLTKLFSGYSLAFPFIASILFIAHPVHTEVVANIKSLDEILSLLFILVTINLTLIFVNKNKVVLLFAIPVFYLLALLSKESAITFIAIIPLTLFFFAKAQTKQLIQTTGMLVIPAAIFLFVRSKVITSFTENSSFSFIDNVLYFADSLLIQWATAFGLLWRYLTKIFFPLTLSSDYTYAQTILHGWENPLSWLSLAIHLTLLIYALLKFKTKSPVSYGILFYLITLSIFSNLIIVIGSPFGERFLFVPLLGICIVASHLLVKSKLISNKVFAKETSVLSLVKNNKLAFVITGLLLMPMSIKTIARNEDWKSNYILFKADATNSPNCARIQYFYANEIRKNKAMVAKNKLEKEKYLDQSIKFYNKAITIYPDFDEAIGALGMSYYRKGDKKSAYAYYEKAINLNTTTATTYNNMGVLFSELGQHNKALQYYQRAVFFDPYYFDAWKNLGNNYYEINENKKSIDAFFTALKYEEDDADANYFLAIGLQIEGRDTEANKYFNIAYRLNPSLKRNN
jgi:protein O-mannosyl-transferase